MPRILRPLALAAAVLLAAACSDVQGPLSPETTIEADAPLQSSGLFGSGNG